jgi:hypothetical protein
MPGLMFMVDVIYAAASKNAGEIKLFVQYWRCYVDIRNRNNFLNKLLRSVFGLISVEKWNVISYLKSYFYE